MVSHDEAAHRRGIGLALAGGGPVGAVYEIGALRALEEALDGLDLNDLDIYVGVSAGALIAAFLANGVTPAQLVREVMIEDPDDPFLPEVFFTPAYREWLRRATAVPRLLGEALLDLARRPNPLKAVRRLTHAIPVAVFESEPIRRALVHHFSRRGRSDDFRQLSHRLVVVATDLGTGTPIRFGEPGWDHVPISTAIQASVALPGLYPPVVINGKHCVDGVLLKTVHASTAFDAGAELVLCVNPIVPVDTSAGVEAGALPRSVLVSSGLPTVLAQTFRTLIHSRLQVGFQSYGARYRGSDFVLFEPDRDEYQMFFSSVFDLSSRRAICDLAYRATRRDLVRRRRRLAPILAKHGVRIRPNALDDLDRDVWTSLGYAPEARSKRSTRHRKVTDSLDQALTRLEAALGNPTKRPTPRRSKSRS